MKSKCLGCDLPEWKNKFKVIKENISAGAIYTNFESKNNEFRKIKN